MKENKYFIEARKLKIMLSCRYEFIDWMKRNIEKNKLVENVDFILGEKDKENYYLNTEAVQKIIMSYPNNKTAQKIVKELKKGNSLGKIFNDIYDLDIRVIKISDEEYPEQLKQITNPPKQIYVKGNIENLNKLGFAVIGTRKCSNYGRKNCKLFTKGLVSYNLMIISGLAIGIDTCAHKSCLEAKGTTIAVLPSGLHKIFPKENKQLLNKIIKTGGTIVSEYPPDFEKTPESCRERNRIMSALAVGTLVIEAQKRSGTSLTVNYTNEQGKKAFCIPAGLQNSKGIGTNQMIKEGIAKIVTEVEDIIKEYPELKLEKLPDFEIDNQKTKKQTKSKKKKEKIEIDEENLEIYNLLSKEPKHIDEISKLLNQPIHEITYKLTMLELEGVIEELPGKKFKIKEERN